jgi:hypothetical protein
MYSAIVNDSGISQHTLEIMVLGSLGILIFGVIFYLYWKQIVFGCLALFGVVVFANHQPAKKPEPAPTPVIEKIVEVEKIVEKPVEVIVEKPVVVEKPVELKPLEVKPDAATEVKPVETKPQPKEELLTKPEDDRKYFVEDCLSYTDYNKKQCEAIWDKREAGDQKLLDVENVAYKKRRAEALKKPGAFVTHYTLQDRK